MDAEKLRAVRELQQHFPALSVTEAREILQQCNWNLLQAKKKAESRECGKGRHDNNKTDAYFVGGGGAHGSGQQVLAPPTNTKGSIHNNNNNDDSNNNDEGNGKDKKHLKDMKEFIEKLFTLTSANRSNELNQDNTYTDNLPQLSTGNNDDTNASSEQHNYSGRMVHRYDNDEETEQTRPQAFFGRGRRLGFTTNPSPFMSSTLRQLRAINVSVYSNGFYVNDEWFVPIESKDGAAFMHALENGYVPEVLAARYPDNDIDMKLIDMQEHEYISPTSLAFTGTGHRLISDNQTHNTNFSTPETADTSTTSNASATQRSETSASTHNTSTEYNNNNNNHPEINNSTMPSFNPQQTFEFNESEPSTSIRLVTTQGKQEVVKVNLHQHTVEDLYYLAHNLQPELHQFVLTVRERPLRTLTNDTRALTIADAKLQRSVIQIQKLEHYKEKYEQQQQEQQ